MVEPTYHTLDNGLRIVHLYLEGSAVGHCGFAVNAGSRDEDLTAGEGGLAHFVEHTIFKGTRRRRSWHIINRMEAVGGELNAFTTKEDTVVYSAFPHGNTRRALELLVDLLTASQFPDVELEREREVVRDEIASYLDVPADAVFDDFEDMIYAGTPLGHNILGTESGVGSLCSADCRRWLARHYTVPHMALFYAGPDTADAFVRLAARLCAAMPTNSDLQAPSAPVTLPDFDAPTRDEVRTIDSHQAHVVAGCALPLCNRRGKVSMALLANILGGPGMNSRLNVLLRERRGLVYSVEASTTHFRDSSMFTVYFGCDHEDRRRCHDIVRRTIETAASTPMTARAFDGARRQYLGQILLADDNTSERIIAIARAMIHHDEAQGGTPRPMTRAELAALMDTLTPDDIKEAAAALASGMNSLALV